MDSIIGLFKIEEADKLPGAQQLAEILRQHLDPKFEIKVGIGGAKKLLSGYTGCKSDDIITIKKNAYHGAVVIIMPERKDVTYQALSVSADTPNPILAELTRKMGFLDALVLRSIFGKGDDLYDKLEHVIQNVLKAKKADLSLLNTIKTASQGKSVLD